MQVGVIQKSGRPFGDVGLSLLACERLVQVLGKTDPGSWQHALQVQFSPNEVLFKFAFCHFF